MRMERKHHSAEEKVAILRRHLLDKMPVSDLSDPAASQGEVTRKRNRESFLTMAPQFIARDFKEFIRISGMTHVRTSPYYPQSNGKIERWHKSLKSECIRPGTPLSLEDARCLVEGYVEHYNNVRLNSATGYIMPKNVLAGRVAGDPRGTRSQAGSRQTATPESPPANRVRSEAASCRDVGH